ncbi:hypothetical protein LY28_02852 [Ruminiclostridium sufflavum DSM 19573]|uniref:SLH domain-containing protein n=1 Tax=Ruminiclostridium sufflavum DSM 19573 TaxID=1121337 RepID=A0A318XJW3_9FIRM|nr:insulinase family protein [Ruminiclostridium sufflavum]PYG86633.1 hypothetical protein LY28_02852 [Ruminiclostridium sufflavum DSM 19573]
MKRLLSLTLVLCLVLTMLFQVTGNANAAEDILKPLPQVGEVVSGFKTVELKNLDLINSKTALFEHEKTGAKLLYIQNKDIDRSFDITFKTPAADNSGINHVLEHITVSGSQKYPLRDVVFTISNQTYSTFVNAGTFSTATTYPLSSMSEEQLLKLTDIYLDCVYHPSVYTDKNVFSREAWRYEMAEANAPLQVKGVVYNEMKGALGNIAAAANVNVLKILFPGSVQGNISGGNPEDIKKLTYEQLIKTHDTYYHPSNSLMILYGNLDYKKFLDLINDEYLSKYEKQDIKIDAGIVTPFSKKAEASFSFPVAAAANTKNAAQIDYAYAITGATEEDVIGLSVIAELLNLNTSPLKKAFAGEQIGGDVTVSLNDMIAQPVITFSVKNADENKAAAFKALVDKCMKNIIKTGFDRDSEDAMMSASLLGNSNFTEAGNIGVNISYLAAYRWANSNNTDYLFNVISNLKSIQAKIPDNYLEKLAAKYIEKNNHAALVTTVPEAGLAEKLAGNEEKYLSDLKVSMSKEEADNIVAATKAYNEWNSEKVNQEVIDDIQAVKISDLPEELKNYQINETKAPYGIRMISADADVGETETTSLLLDTSAIPVEKLHYLQLYSSLLGRLDTKTYTHEELNAKILRYLGGVQTSLSTISREDTKQFNPYLTIAWMGLMDEYEQQVDLVRDILLNTRFDNSEIILSNVKTLIANWKAAFSSEPIHVQMDRISAQFDDDKNFQSYISGIEYYSFLTEVEKALASNPKAVIAELEEINKLVINKTDMITAFCGNKSNIKNYENAIKRITDALPAQRIEKQDYTKIPRPSLKEGIAVDSAVQYNMVFATYDKMDTKFSGKYIPVGLVINENYTTPKIRLGNGAYGNIENINSNGFLFASYRDPNIKETFEIFKGIPEFLKNIDITQKELDRYILKAFSTYSAPSGELVGAGNAISGYLSGKQADAQLKILREIKALTVQDVKDTAAIVESLIKNGACSTAGSMQKLTENKELYDAIVAIDQGTEETLTRAQFFDVLLSGVPDTMAFAKQNGLITGDGKGNYFENNKVTRQELAVIITKAAALNGVQLNGKELAITDIGLVSPYAAEGVRAAVNSGVMKLDDKGNFNPRSEIKMSELQTILTDFVNKLTGK